MSSSEIFSKSCALNNMEVNFNSNYNTNRLNNLYIEKINWQHYDNNTPNNVQNNNKNVNEYEIDTNFLNLKEKDEELNQMESNFDNSMN